MPNRSTLIRPVFAAACAMLAVVAAPALASEHPATSAAGTSSQGVAEKKICLSPTVTGEPTVTGSILARRECRTKAEWEARGVQFQTR